MNVYLADEQELPVNDSQLTSLARHTLEAEDVDDEAELSVLFVTADHIKRLNARFAGNDYATDVLAFPMIDGDDDDDRIVLGDVVICPEIAKRNAERLGHGLETELATLLVHGTLHLLGYDHQGEDDKARMEARLAELMGSFATRGAEGA